MAELASGAVRSLLGVIRNEARLLDGVQGDVQFIREEMESMNSFLMHLARTAARGHEHDEQVRTWMSQVRLLAQDCNNCLDIYLYRGNPDIHLPKEGFWRYLLWTPWYLRKLVAQHHAANQLRELKERASDVGKRRLRYGVEIPTTKPVQLPAGNTSAAKASAQEAPTTEAGGGEEDDEDGEHRSPATEVDRLFGSHDLEEYFSRKLADWIKKLKGESSSANATESKIPSIAIVAPGNILRARALAHGAADEAEKLNFRTVMIEIPRIHYLSEPLGSQEILCYMWRELELEHAKSQSSSSQQQGTTSSQGEEKKQHIHWQRTSKLGVYFDKRNAIRQIMTNIQETMKLDTKIEEIKSDIDKVTADELDLDLGKAKDDKQDDHKFSNKSLPVLLLLLKRSTAAMAAEQYQERKKKTGSTSEALCNNIIKETTKKLKHLMEAGAKEVTTICLDRIQYEDILREIFLQDQEQYTATASTSALREDQIEVKIREAKREILLEVERMLEGKTGKKQAAGEPVFQDETLQANPAETKEKIEKTQVQIPPDEIADVKEKIKGIQQKIEALMKTKGIMDKIINYYSKDRRTLIIILNIGRDYVLGWEEARNTLMLLDCVAGALIVTASRDTQRAKEYCSPTLEPMECSLVGLYQNIALELTRKLEEMDEEGDNHIDSHVFRSILDECGPYEFSMKIFAHALYSNPKRSREELEKLHKTMKQVMQKSVGKLAKKMLKFSYSDLPKEYKTCLLYLAIFPRGYKITRSTLIGRWVAEGLITTDDWRWHISVQEAERCFDVLVNRWLVYPADIGATGKVKSCIVGDFVYEFIIKIAKKQRILETRMSHHLARHFSISNDLHLRGSDTIDKFLQRLYESSHLSVLKLLDLEGCHCFKKKQSYLKDICSKVLLLKYLSLRRTDVTWLPSEINNLHELEVLDIRETQLPPHATRHVRLLKLKRLLAGQSDPSPSNTGSRSEEIPSSVQIPEKIEKMLDMEVLSNVKGTSHDLKDIGKLWQLRKLGVSIDDKESQLKNLLRTISDLHECLQSLSITLPTSVNKDTTSEKLPDSIASKRTYPPKHLKNLRISGTTKLGRLLPLLVTNDGQLAKVTLRNTWLHQEDLDILADLPTLHYLKLQCEAYSESELTFKEDKFKNLKYILVEGSKITDLSFHGGAPVLEKIVLPFTGLNLNGVPNLLKLEEVELTNTSSTTTTNNSNSNSNINIINNTSLSIFKDATQIAKMTLRRTLLKQDDLRAFAKESKIRCLMLLDKSYVESKLTFNKNEFPKLNLLILNCSCITNVSFDRESAPKINKIVWYFKKMESLSGINNLQRLRELEFNGDLLPLKVKEDIKNHKNQPYYLHNTQEIQDQAIGNTNEEVKAVARFLCWKHVN